MHSFAYVCISAVSDLRTYHFWSSTNSYSVLGAKTTALRHLVLQPSLSSLLFHLTTKKKKKDNLWGKIPTINEGQRRD